MPPYLMTYVINLPFIRRHCPSFAIVDIVFLMLLPIERTKTGRSMKVAQITIVVPSNPLHPHIIPLPWHLQAWNSGTVAFMIWVGLLCLIEFINSLIWASDAINRLPIWCDISSQLIAAAGVGIPASTLCISRRLYRIVSTQTASITRDDKKRAIYEDLAIGVGLPVFVLLLHTIVQPHRFDIFEEYGCAIVTYNTLPAYFLYYMWPILIGMISFVYSSLILRTFYIRRIQFNQLLSNNGAINPSRYLRLMLLALMDIMCTIPLGTYIVYINVHGYSLRPWISWEDTHFDYGQVDLIPSVIWRSSHASTVALQINRWTPIVCAFIFFALFGFAEEARKNYRRAFWFVVKPFGFRPAFQFSGNGKGGIISGLKKFKFRGETKDDDALPVYAPAANSSARKEFRKSILDADSRSTICFPDDADVELGSYRKSFDTQTVAPTSPSSSTSIASPRTPLTPPYPPMGLPPSYVDAALLNASALALAEPISQDAAQRKSSWVSLPDFIVESSEHPSRPSSSNASFISRGDHLHSHDLDADDHISITDAYFDDSSRPTSLVRVPTPVPFSSELSAELGSRVCGPGSGSGSGLRSQDTTLRVDPRRRSGPRTTPMFIPMPVLPPPALAFHRPFSPPSVYLSARPYPARDLESGNGNGNGSRNGLRITVHTQSSIERF
ncbi:hypothetical protein D9757_012753 [Collybiopsis confluens]|uniref:Pheromone receptor n=1 Tax=Collybiopsis confluens TaxID=2823264 RepID=A0A8H5GL05_9AGAR|nr:hypothetical protein D9757_012753 [Collybiopsis confluens]